MKETASDEKWKEIGLRAKLIDNEIGDFIVSIAPYVPKKTLDGLYKAQKGLSKFKSDAEEEMFNQYGPKNANIFYGEIEGESASLIHKICSSLYNDDTD